MKKKLANLLRLWASKLSPKYEPYRPDFGMCLPTHTGEEAYYEVKSLGAVYAIPPDEERRAFHAERNGYLDAVKNMRKEYEKRIARGIVVRLLEDGVVEYSEERNPETGELIVGGFLYVGIRKDNISLK